MTGWRKRIAEARARGTFNRADHEAWWNPSTCFVGEQRRRYGIQFNLQMAGIGEAFPELQTAIHFALVHDDFNAAEELLDYVEDRALELKREAQ